MRTEISYRVGSIEITYRGTAKPLWRWLWDTQCGWPVLNLYYTVAMRLWDREGVRPSDAEISARIVQLTEHFKREGDICTR